MTIFIIVKRWQGGKMEFGPGYYNEDTARLEAGKLVTNDFNCAIHLQTIQIMDYVK